MTWLRRLFGASVLMVLLGSAAAAVASAARVKPSETVVLHPRVRVVVRRVATVRADARYVVFDEGGRLGLIDDQTGRRTAVVVPSSCRYPGPPLEVGGGSLVTGGCAAPDADSIRYSIASGRWAPVSFGGLDRDVVAMGSRWVEGYGSVDLTFDGGLYACSEHCAYEYSFVNLATGRVLAKLPSWHTGSTTVPDLNSPTLAARLCSPLRVPQGAPNDSTSPDDAPNPLTFAGPFAVGVAETVSSGHPDPSGGNLLLERCGTRLRRKLAYERMSYPSPGDPTDPANLYAINRHAVIWVDGGSLHGLFLPSLQPFRILLRGSYSSATTSVFLTSRTLYVWNDDLQQSGSLGRSGDLLAMAAPTSP